MKAYKVELLIIDFDEQKTHYEKLFREEQ